MIDIHSVAVLVRDTVRDLSNLAGLIERNLSSYDRMKARFRRRRIERRLQELLGVAASISLTNRQTIWQLARLANPSDDVRVQTLTNQHGWIYDSWDEDYQDFYHFLERLLKARGLIEEYKTDLIHVDYHLYEELEDAIQKRIAIVGMLTDDQDREKLSQDKLKVALSSYVALMEAIGGLKDALQREARSLSDTDVRKTKASSSGRKSQTAVRKTKPGKPRT